MLPLGTIGMEYFFVIQTRKKHSKLSLLERFFPYRILEIMTACDTKVQPLGWFRPTCHTIARLRDRRELANSR